MGHAAEGGGALSEETEMQSHGGILAEPCMEIPAWISLAVEAYFQQSAGLWQKRGVEKPQGYHLGDNLVVLSQMSPAVAARIDPLAAEVDLENLALQDTSTPAHQITRASGKRLQRPPSEWSLAQNTLRQPWAQTSSSCPAKSR